MTTPRYARLASKALMVEMAAAPPPSADQRARAILEMQNAIVARGRHRRRQRWLLGVAAAAAVAASVGGVARVVRTRQALPQAVQATAPAAPPPPESPAATDVTLVAHPVGSDEAVVVQRPLAPFAGGWTLSRGSRVVTTRAGRALLAFSTGTDVAVEEASDVTVGRVDASQELRIDSGAIDLHVAALAGAQRFLVRTSDAEVEVRGTRFRVAVVPVDAACGGGTATRVSVREGVVVVRHANSETRVGAGERGPAGCGSPAAPAAASAVAAGRVTTGPAPTSVLGEQNDLFSDALAAKRRGDSSGAIARFDEFLARYPSSPLVESAEIERMRILRSVDPGAARQAAKRYLARFPRGLGHAQAEAILAETR
jgi:hypothetical protein